MNLDMAGFALGLRELVLALIGLVVLYILVVLVRMRRLRARGEPAAAPVTGGRAEPMVAVAAATPPQAKPDEVAWQEPPEHQVQETFMRGIEAEVDQLRDEVDMLRGELAALREELRTQMTQVKAAQTVSPLYSDAMQMANLGHDAATIAERCGIARAEAELVVALVKNQEM